MNNLKLILLSLFVLLSLYVSAQDKYQKQYEKGEVLYNGIQIPSIWPPQSIDLKSEKPQIVPYLESPPKYINISVGRQLFVDDFLIEQTSLERKFHQASKYLGNPVVYATSAYEKEGKKGENRDVTYLGHGGVFYDPLDDLYKMFYTAGWRGALAIATSKDIYSWKKPSINKKESNIILEAGISKAGEDNSIWLDLNAANDSERIKYLTDRRTKDKVKGRHSLIVSDGTTWSPSIQVNSNQGDYSSFFYNPFREKWIFSIKKSDSGPRSRMYLEADNFLDGWDWENAVDWIRADSLDLPDPRIGDKAQLYSLNAIAYESLLLGEFYIHLGPSNNICEKQKEPKITELKLGYSRDGFHWHRPDRKAFIAASRKDGVWDKGYIHGTTGVCLVKGDSLYFPYTGFSGIATDGNKSMYTGASIGLATLRRDGFASLEIGNKEGYLTTRLLKFDGKYLFVNVSSKKGCLRAEILDENNHVIPGYEAVNCIPIATDKTLHKVEWKNVKDLVNLSGKKIKIRFYLKNGALYSFWITPDIYGASFGYQGGGSAGLNGVIDNMGLLNY